MSYGGLPRDYKLPTVDPDQEDETLHSNGFTINLPDGCVLDEEYDDSKVDIVVNGRKAKMEWSEMAKAFNNPCWSQPVEKKAEGCNHKWKAYLGLSEQFEYCEICDEKRK